MFWRFLFWLLLPVTALQGLWLRRKALRLPGAPGERRGSCGDGQALHLLALGDSIIDGVGTDHVEESLPVQFACALAEELGRRVEWLIEGQTGNTIDNVMSCLEAVDESYLADVVLLSVGVNNVTGLTSTRYWRSKLEELLVHLGRRFPEARIIFTGLPPMSRFPLPPQPLRFSLGLRATTLDRIASSVIARYPNARHVPTIINPAEHGFCEDGFHPSAESCTLWARELALTESRRETA
jgi:lysophospholipase L1-like esterase